MHQTVLLAFVVESSIGPVGRSILWLLAATCGVGGNAVVTRGSFVERKALAVNRSKHNSPHIKYPSAQKPLVMVEAKIVLE